MARRGPAFAITDEWRRLVMARMSERRWNKATLARALDCSRTAVTDMLTTGPSSALVPEVERAIGIEISSQSVDPTTQEIVQTMPSTGQIVRLSADRKPGVPVSELISGAVGHTVRPELQGLPRDTTGAERVQYAESVGELVKLYLELSTRNRIKAMLSLRALIDDQTQIENEVKRRIQDEERLVLDEKLDRLKRSHDALMRAHAAYSVLVDSGNVSDPVRHFMIRMLTQKTRQDLEKQWDDAVKSEILPPQASPEYEQLSRIYELLRDSAASWDVLLT